MAGAATRDEIKEMLEAFARDTLEPMVFQVEKNIIEQLPRGGMFSGAQKMRKRTSFHQAVEEEEEPHDWLSKHLRLFGAQATPQNGNGLYLHRRSFSASQLTDIIDSNEEEGDKARGDFAASGRDSVPQQGDDTPGSDTPFISGSTRDQLGVGLPAGEADEDDEERSALVEGDQDKAFVVAGTFGEDDDDDEPKTLRGKLDAALSTSAAEAVVGAAVLANALLIGAQTRVEASTSFKNVAAPPAIYATTDTFFCVFFVIEITMRIVAKGERFLSAKEWSWNTFDLLVVCLQLVDKASFLLAQDGYETNVGMLRVLRILRLVRLTRLLRMLRLVEDLHTIVGSIAESMRSLCWTMLILVMIIYAVAVCLTQIVLIHQESVLEEFGELPETEMSDRLFHYFGALERSFLTLFAAIAGGISWQDSLEPLIEEISPFMAVPFCIYICFAIFALMNVVTGVFVEKAIANVQEDREDYLANHIRELFFKEPTKHGVLPTITWGEFKDQLQHEDMVSYFKAINVDISEAKGLFKLLDCDGSGSVDPEELVSGLLRLRGPAKALQLSLLLSETVRMNQRLSKHIQVNGKHMKMLEEAQEYSWSAA